MNREAIEFTIRQLREIAANEAFAAHFTLGYWANQLTTHEVDEPEDPGCGFTGCYMGWAIHQQWYAPWGLRLGFVHKAPSGPLEDSRSSFNQLPNKLSIFPEVLEESTLSYQKYRPKLPGRSDNALGALAAVGEVLGLQTDTLEKVIYEEAYRNGEQAGPDDVANRFAEILEFGEDGFMDVQIEREEAWAAEDNDV